MNKEIYKILTELGFENKLEDVWFKKPYYVNVNFSNKRFNIHWFKMSGKQVSEIKFTNDFEDLKDFEDKIRSYLIKLSTARFYLE